MNNFDKIVRVLNEAAPTQKALSDYLVGLDLKRDSFDPVKFKLGHGVYLDTSDRTVGTITGGDDNKVPYIMKTIGFKEGTRGTKEIARINHRTTEYTHPTLGTVTHINSRLN